MRTLKLYHFDQLGYFYAESEIEETDAIPRGVTYLKVPELNEREEARFVGTCWVAVPKRQ